ncbi:MAG: hypothetical protein JXQ73_16980 [Phycisphaerae bacterium]|nr:hypothetical protein [Phycisphaerae bacterium]
MQRHVVVVLLVVSIMSGTMLVGCSGASILTSTNPLLTLPLQLIGGLLLDAVVGPLLGDPAGDLNQDSGGGDSGAVDN